MIVGTWNLENLFRPGSDAGPSDEQAYDAKLTELARVIGELALDVLAVQEGGDRQAMEDLRKRVDDDWFAESSELPDTRGIRVGFLSRLGFGEVGRHAAARPGCLDGRAHPGGQSAVGHQPQADRHWRPRLVVVGTVLRLR